MLGPCYNEGLFQLQNHAGEIFAKENLEMDCWKNFRLNKVTLKLLYVSEYTHTDSHITYYVT